MKTAGLAGNGVKVTKIIEDDISDLRKVYDPTHPDADEEDMYLIPMLT